ncbi:MAG: cytochrome c biogenesis CcdA family protein [Actinomycetota bacterium]
MDSGVFFGGSVVAAVVAGSIALFAPCCISVMLPAYFASSFQNRRVLVAMTFLFAAGVATVILPIAVGAQAVRRVFTAEHTTIYLIGALVLLGLGAYTLLGGQMHLPMPGRRAGGKAGPLGVFSLGVFSGIASSCCAPVLAGVIALSGVASSFALAVGLGSAYVLGMVAPLFAISLLWERRDWRSSRLFRPRSFTWRMGPLRRTISGTSLASGVLLLIMGVATLWIGLAGSAMPSPGGWAARFTATLQHYGQVVTDALSWIPGWAAVLALGAVIALLAGRALRQISQPSDAEPEHGEHEEPLPALKEEILEREDA